MPPGPEHILYAFLCSLYQSNFWQEKDKLVPAHISNGYFRQTSGYNKTWMGSSWAFRIAMMMPTQNENEKRLDALLLASGMEGSCGAKAHCDEKRDGFVIRDNFAKPLIGSHEALTSF